MNKLVKHIDGVRYAVYYCLYMSSYGGEIMSHVHHWLHLSHWLQRLHIIPHHGVFNLFTILEYVYESIRKDVFMILTLAVVILGLVWVLYLKFDNKKWRSCLSCKWKKSDVFSNECTL